MEGKNNPDKKIIFNKKRTIEDLEYDQRLSVVSVRFV